MTETARRVALLVRPGVAGDRLRELLAEAGIESVLQGDPTELAAEALAESGPQVVLVALDPETEDALERFDTVLGNPDVDVIYEEAELAAMREGWEAARWKRHLLAKLQGHDRVLPPRPDGSLDVESEPLKLHNVEDVSDEALRAFDATSGQDSIDSGASIDSGIVAPAVAVSTPAVNSLMDASSLGAPGLDALSLNESEEELSLNEMDSAGIEFSLDDAGDAGEPEADTPVLVTLDSVDDADDPTPDTSDSVIELDAADFQFPGSSFDPALAEAEEASGSGDSSGFEITFDLSEKDDTERSTFGDSDGGLEAHLESLIRGSSEAPVEEDAIETASSDAGGSDAMPASDPGAPPVAKSGSVFGELSLDDGDSLPATSETRATDDRFGRDLADLDERIASLELVDDNAAREASVPGAVLIMAGIGGPDAVRQLLGALPTDFSRPVLVQQRLDGGRYDRLVAQMQRATTLPVHLAEPGKPAMAGFVYMLPAGLGINAGKEGMRFMAEGSALAALPPADSAVILLSGSDPTDVDQILKHHAGGALVAGQAAEGCYDASASDQLVARGGESGQPVELAQRLAARWPA